MKKSTLNANTEKQVLMLSGQQDDRSSMSFQLPARRRRGRWFWLSFLILVVVAAGVGGYLYFGKSQQAPSWQTQAVTQGNLSVSVNATGSLVAATYNVDFNASGTIAEIDVSVGQQVHKGEVLARLNRTALQDALKQAQDTLKFDQDMGDFPDQIRLAQDAVDSAQHNLNNATLHAPHSGIITTMNGTIGSASSGAHGSDPSGTTSFIQIQDEATMWVRVNVNEADMAALAPGNTVSFTLDAFRASTFQGQVSAIGHLAQSANNTTTYPVTVEVPAAQFQGLHIIPGMNVDATIIVLTHPHVLLVPVQAVSFARQAETSGQVRPADVQAATEASDQLLAALKQSQGPALAQDQPKATFVLELKNGNLAPVPIVLGATDGTSYEVLAGLTLPASLVLGSGSSQNSTSGSGK